MRLTIFKLLFPLVLASPLAASATVITAGPLTFGSNIPFYVSDNGNIGGGIYLVQLDGPEVYSGATGPQVLGSDVTTTFSFSIAPGWQISGIWIGGSLDYGYTGYPEDVGPTWAYEFGQNLTLCSAGGVCSSDSQVLAVGRYPLPPINFNAVTGSGTGTYQTILYLKDASVGSVAPPHANIFLTQIPAPEPGSLLLTTTGIAGAFGVFRRSRRTT